VSLLTELQVKNAEHRVKEYFLSDSDGLYLRVRLTRKVWLYRYKRNGKEVKLGLGRYPVVSLARAREKARMEREKRADGLDPKAARRDERERAARLNTFELLACAWHAEAQKDRQWSVSYAEKIIRYLELHVFPWIGELSMEDIKPTEVVRCLHRIKVRGHLETAMRVRETVQRQCEAQLPNRFVRITWAHVAAVLRCLPSSAVRSAVGSGDV
jgi:hypothetical protein